MDISHSNFIRISSAVFIKKFFNIFLEFVGKKGFIFKIFQKSFFASILAGLVYMFVACLVEIDQVFYFSSAVYTE